VVTLEELGGWPAVLGRLCAGQDLSPELATAAMGSVLLGEAGAAQIAAFAVGLRMKGETVEEMAGFVAAMLEVAERVPVDAEGLIDTCGTGGDRSGTINVSTIAAFVATGAGARVCKHGGGAATSQAGSADVLRALGVAVELGPAEVARCVEEIGMGFCFAPRFHPAMRHAVPVRRELAVPTVFNFLGPLANPARVRRQVVGVSDPRMAQKVLGVLAANGAEHAMVVYGHDGLDELTTVDTSTILEWRDGVVRTIEVDPGALGLKPATREQLLGGDAATNALAAHAVLDGTPGPQRDVVILNAAAALVVAGIATDLADGLERAGASIDGGHAAAVLTGLATLSTQLSLP
jgi:anthranilate phosphoribosyltransferase